MPRLIVATGNAGKIREIRELLVPTGWAVLAPADLSARPRGVDVAESGRSYVENAVAKAIAYARAARLPALADDSGLEVDALEGRPGVLSARYGGPAATDADRNARLLAELADVPEPRRTARFRAVVALALPGGAVYTREGVVEGRIALAPRGTNGFGYDPLFEPVGDFAGHARPTMAELGAEKQVISHRARAVRAMIDVLRGLPADDARRGTRHRFAR